MDYSDSAYYSQIVAVVMWIFVNLLILLAVNVNWTHGLHIVSCTGTVYMDCNQYCQNNCRKRGLDCIYHCENGCGCVKSHIVRNNGGCYELMKCKLDDRSVEKPDPTPPKPCNKKVKEKENENGDKLLAPM